jgi:hypothetical protein
MLAQEWEIFLLRLKKVTSELVHYRNLHAIWANYMGALEHAHQLNTPQDEEHKHDLEHTRLLLQEAERSIDFARTMIAVAGVAERWDHDTNSPRSMLSCVAPIPGTSSTESRIALNAERQIKEAGSPWGHLMAGCKVIQDAERSFERLERMLFNYDPAILPS